MITWGKIKGWSGAQAPSSQDTCKYFIYWLLVEHSWVVKIPSVVDPFGPDNQP